MTVKNKNEITQCECKSATEFLAEYKRLLAGCGEVDSPQIQEAFFMGRASAAHEISILKMQIRALEKEFVQVNPKVRHECGCGQEYCDKIDCPQVPLPMKKKDLLK